MEELLELDYRTDGTLEISLLWDRAANTLCVQVFDRGLDELFSMPVPASSALEVFKHPYAYASPVSVPADPRKF